MRLTKNKALLLTACLAGTMITGCSNTKETLGLNRQAPDEFAVVKRAPLEMPPNYNLTPPNPGAPRPQEMQTSDQAKETVFGGSGENNYAPSSSEEVFLQKAGATNADPGIRRAVDLEYQESDDSKKPVVKRLLGWGGMDGDEKAATVVNAPEEAERLKSNAQAGKPVTEGETPVIEE